MENRNKIIDYCYKRLWGWRIILNRSMLEISRCWEIKKIVLISYLIKLKNYQAEQNNWRIKIN